MSAIEVRPFRRSDRQQLTNLVNAHAQAVVPGASASINVVLSQLEREPGEFITDPWVSERATLVAAQNDRVAAAAHLLRYYPDDRAGEHYRDMGEIRWFLFWPLVPAGNRWWPDVGQAAEALMSACIARFESWGVAQQGAGGELPVRGVYGVPEQWPHIVAIYERSGFIHDGDSQAVYLARVPDLPRPPEPPVAGLAAARSVGINGTRISARLGDEVIGYIEVETFDDGERQPRDGGWADIGNLRVTEPYRRRGVGKWLLAQAAHWLDLARVDRLLDYATVDRPNAGGQDDAAYRAFLTAVGFTELTRTRRGWTREPGS